MEITETIIKIFFTTLGAIVGMFILGLFLSIPTMLLWNWLIPVLVPSGILASEINLFQAWGLSFLIGILFNSRVSIN